MIFKPHQYQEYAIKKILELPECGLFLDMGMGKTASALTALDELLFNLFEVSKVLIIAPLRVAESTWTDEIEKWEHLKGLRIAKVLGEEKDRLAALRQKVNIFTINRENVKWLVELYGKKWPFDMVVIDELSNFKSPASQRFKKLKKVRALIKRVLGLTGTPSPNGYLDLWAQVYLLDQGERLGKTFTGYKERYFEPDKRNGHIVYSWRLKPGAEEAIYAKISDICVSMLAKDWLTMPERINNVIKVKLPDEAKLKYKQLEKDLLLPLTDSDIVANTAAVLSNKLLQMANGAVYDENGQAFEIHQGKLEALSDLIESANGNPVLVFYSYKHDLTRIQSYLKKYQVRELKTAQDIKDWNIGKVSVMVAHPASTGHGLNLQAGGNVIIWFGIPWSLELYQQANARLDRQGQKNGVIINHLVTESTMDEDVMRSIENKAVGQNALLEAVKAKIERIRRGLHE
ncbi:DEAD/DEAH box helicase [Pelosinus sp. IPA-1]|uniref:DEAD/DEAH box helicase n=1 Tax=Pelosinus sp. IPA-1 TaxID=3029569 RepID=UPI0024361F48|nr:DEAD/DEAH box helicase [Pelosinus sp. IPA-1]GMB00905.1 DEAD/DEAH box helicase [Pelosinus sp. IPA-1]